MAHLLHRLPQQLRDSHREQVPAALSSPQYSVCPQTPRSCRARLSKEQHPVQFLSRPGPPSCLGKYKSIRTNKVKPNFGIFSALKMFYNGKKKTSLAQWCLHAGGRDRCSRGQGQPGLPIETLSPRRGKEREARIPETTQVSTVMINKPGVVCSNRGILFSHKKEGSVEDVTLSGGQTQKTTYYIRCNSQEASTTQESQRKQVCGSWKARGRDAGSKK